LENDVAVPPSHSLTANIKCLQWNPANHAAWEAVANTLDDIDDINDPYTFSCLEEAYFAIQDNSEHCTAAHTRVLKRFMKYMIKCPLDVRFNYELAKVVYGSENYDFYVNVCKAFGTMV
jgi:hypothetical protein